MTQQLWTDVDHYLNDTLLPADPDLDAALEDSAKGGLPAIAVAPNQGKLLHLLARLQGARRILEVGTLGGYGTIWLARALPPGGRVVTLELSDHHARVARGNLERAGVADRVEIRVGPALETLPRLAAEKPEPFDLSFIDADKQSNPEYFGWALRLSRKGSLIVIDNVVREGSVMDAASTDASTKGVRRLFEAMAAERRVIATALQTVGTKGHDGLAFALVVGD
jgi:predicted O-methyltransferase YrrM